jgi:preprotein translocase subunit SecD
MKIVWKAILLAGFSLMALSEPLIASEIELRLVVPCDVGLVKYPSPFTDKKPICVSSDVIASDANIVRVNPSNNKSIDGLGVVQFEFEFDGAGRARLAEITENNIGRQIAFLSQGRLVTAAVINGPIRGGEMTLTLPDKDGKSVLRLFQDRKVVK